MSKQQDEILIIGGGIIGVSTAYYLAKQGRSVTVVEKDAIGAGSSHGNAGLIANGFAYPLAGPGVIGQGLRWMLDAEGPFYFKPRLDLDLFRWLWKFRAACNETKMRQSIPLLLSLGQGSFDLFDELLAKETIAFGYEHKGRLLVFTSEKGFEKRAADAEFMKQYGVKTTLLNEKELHEMEPNLLPSVRFGIHCDNYAHVIPHRFVDELARVAEEKGVSFKTGTSVLGFETSGLQISAVTTTQGSFKPNQVVLAAGAWSAPIARDLSLGLLMQPAKGYSLTFTRPPTSPSLPLALSERDVAVTPMGDTLRLTSTLELVGFDPSPSRRRVAAIRRAANEYLPGMADLGQGTIWSGYRPLTPDDLPIIGRSEKYGNLILATGHGTLGMTHGLITGKLVSELIAGEKPSIDLDPFRAERFSS